jgi:hypothetical protein
MDNRISFFAMLGFVKNLSGELRDLYTFRTLHVSLVRLKLEYASCVWWPFNDDLICLETLTRRLLTHA